MSRPHGTGSIVRVVNTFPLSPAQRERLVGAHPSIDLVHVPAGDQAGVDAIVDDRAQVLLADFVPTDRSSLPSLRWLQYSGAGVDGLAARAPWTDGLIVTTASGANAPAVAEYVIAAMLDVTQRGRRRRELQDARRWAEHAEERSAVVGRSLADCTLTLVGYGSLGREIARLARAFGTRVLAVKARPDARADDGYVVDGRGDPAGGIPERVVGPAELADVVGEADFVVIAVPSTSRTRGTLGHEVLAAMRSDAWLINVGRGDLFVEEELVDHVRRRAIAGATLDVTAPEPLPGDSALWGVDDVVLTPHVAGDVDGIWDAIVGLVAENLRRFADDMPLLNVVRANDGY